MDSKTLAPNWLTHPTMKLLFVWMSKFSAAAPSRTVPRRPQQRVPQRSASQISLRRKKGGVKGAL